MERTAVAAWMREHWLPVAALVVICAGIIAYGLLYSTNERGISAYLAGENTARAIVIWLAFRYVIARDIRLGIVWVAIVPIFASLMIASHFGHARAQHELHRLASLLQSGLQQAAVASGVPGAEDAPAPGLESPASDGSQSPVEQIASRYIRRVSADHAAYVKDLERTGLLRLIDPARLREDPDLSLSRKIISESNRVMDLHQAKARETEDWLLKTIAEFNAGAGRDDEFLTGMARGIVDSRAGRMDLWRMDREMVSELEKIIDLLASRSNWGIADESIYFESTDDADIYSRHLARFDEIADQQDRIRGAEYAKAMRSLDAARQAQ